MNDLKLVFRSPKVRCRGNQFCGPIPGPIHRTGLVCARRRRTTRSGSAAQANQLTDQLTVISRRLGGLSGAWVTDRLRVASSCPDIALQTRRAGCSTAAEAWTGPSTWSLTRRWRSTALRTSVASTADTWHTSTASENSCSSNSSSHTSYTYTVSATLPSVRSQSSAEKRYSPR